MIKNPKIRVLTYGHNEIDMLPLKKKWCDLNNIELVYFDNESTDGSREWAIEQGVFHSDILTDGAFDIVHIIQHLENYRQQEQQNYDWSILCGVDTFFIGATITDVILAIDQAEFRNCDSITAKGTNICRCDTQEQIELEHLTHHTEIRNLTFISKSTNKIEIDNIGGENNLFLADFWWINLGNIKPPIERLKTYERRKLAWERGLNLMYGEHYRTLREFKFIMPKELLFEIDENPSLRQALETLSCFIEKE